MKLTHSSGTCLLPAVLLWRSEHAVACLCSFGGNSVIQVLPLLPMIYIRVLLFFSSFFGKLAQFIL